MSDNGFDDSEYRTSVEEVRLEIEAEGVPIAELTDKQVGIVGIKPAAFDVDDLLSDSGMSDARLELLERYIAGHNLLASGIEEVRQADVVSESDGSSHNFARPSSQESGFDETSLGRKAIEKDTSNTLVNLNKPGAVIRTPDATGPRRGRSRR